MGLLKIVLERYTPAATSSGAQHAFRQCKSQLFFQRESLCTERKAFSELPMNNKQEIL